MFSEFVFSAFILCLLSVDRALTAIICNNSQIDAITHSSAQKMYFISIGGYYWWIKDTELPIKESDAQKLPEPFKKPLAAVPVNALDNCGDKRLGVQSKQKLIYLVEQINGIHKLIGYDTSLNKWLEPIDYDHEHCLAKARVDWAKKPITTMFADGLLIGVVQDDSYAMVDCHFICEVDYQYKFGKDFKQQKITDFHTNDTIRAMFRNNGHLYVLGTSGYYQWLVFNSDKEGKIVAKKPTEPPKNILTDLLKLDNISDCSADIVTEEVVSPIGPDSSDGPQPSDAAQQPSATSVITADTTPKQNNSGRRQTVSIFMAIVVTFVFKSIRNSY